MVFPDGIQPLTERPIKNTICLFDVDGTLTPARRAVSPSMLTLLHTLRQKTAIGFVGGSDLAKQQEQLSGPSSSSSSSASVTRLFDYAFAQNGLTAFRGEQALAATSFIGWLGEDRYKRLVNFCLRYLADLDVPVKRGTFVEFRAGMVNVSPVGRNASVRERAEFEAWDRESRCREKFIEALRAEFADLGLTYSIGGQISFDVFPTGWDKTYCLRHLENEAKLPGGVEYTTIHFFGDKTYKGGNDYEIYHDPRVTGHAVTDPEDTERQVRALFDL